MAEAKEKKKYDTPRLVLFGTVRNMTGGSGTHGRDGAVLTKHL